MIKFIIEQKIAFATNAYRIFKAGDSGQQGDLFAYVQQKRLALKEKVFFYRDESKREVLFTLRAEKRMDIHGKYVIEDTEGNSIGYIRREFKASLLRSTWKIYESNDSELFTAREKSQALAIARRVGDLLPYIGFVFNLLPYHFEFISGSSNVGGMSRKLALRDKYELEYIGDKKIDPRMLVALGVSLDVLQSR